MIQGVINRMANNSFMLKGWAVAIISALFALSASYSNAQLITVSYWPILIIWVLDGYYLSLEKLFIDRYDIVRKLPEKKVDYSMAIKFDYWRWAKKILSLTLIIFYLGMILSVFVAGKIFR